MGTNALKVIAGALALASILLFGLLPYASGYGAERVSLISFTTNLWQLEEWQHCWLVPFVAGYLVWRKRAELAKTPLSPAYTGIFPLLFGLFAYWVGYRVDNYFIGITSLLFILLGAIILLFGWRWMKALAFPWVFLFFALPLLFLESMLAFRLRLIMSDASVFLLNGIGIATVQQGTAILSAPSEMIGLPRGAAFSVDVADPCSGIRSLFALTMVTALYAYFAIKPMWKQFALFACAVPLAIVGNMARIMMLTLGTIAVGPEIAIGTLEDPSLFHQIAGYLVFVVALAGMIGLGNLLLLDWTQTIISAREWWRSSFSQRNSPLRPAPATGNSEPHMEDEY